jgi:hypothetical protein
MEKEKDIRFSKKKVDETWKEETKEDVSKKAAQQETAKAEKAEKKVKTSTESQKKFINFLMGIATQALYLMGVIEGGPEKDLDGAKEMIDIIELIKERTDGNLSPEEQKAIEKIIYDLEMKFVQISEAGTPPSTTPPSS